MMGVLPLQFLDGESPESLGLTGRESFSIIGVENGEAQRGDGARRRQGVPRARPPRHPARARVPPPRRDPPVRPAPPPLLVVVTGPPACGQDDDRRAAPRPARPAARREGRAQGDARLAARDARPRRVARARRRRLPPDGDGRARAARARRLVDLRGELRRPRASSSATCRPRGIVQVHVSAPPEVLRARLLDRDPHAGHRGA